MDALNYDQLIAILFGAVAFCYCLILATLLFVIKLWLDVYHNRFFEFVEKRDEETLTILKLLYDAVKREK